MDLSATTDAFQVAQTVHLACGETLCMPLRAGSVLCVLSGDVMVMAPLQWCSETMLSAAVPVREAQAHPIGHTGWVRVRAEARSELVVWTPVSLWERLRRRWPGAQRWLSAARAG